ncbi:hypothetical protein [endosymbiont DhMRE of Dentiscutata heterogama]|uniref:hypothetical protein n=1 Tax=endosymbiont DhMRE of Dentiscutata heterogama TaxID=1609546 RepID=UPI002AD5534D|nr:hypothetical protein [endosymbiont DhMRE of Dentiscutata heterogama]
MKDLSKAKNNKSKKRKLLTDPNRLWTRCKTCQEPGNLENLIYQKIPVKNKEKKELFGCYEGIYFCSEDCQNTQK